MKTLPVFAAALPTICWLVICFYAFGSIENPGTILTFVCGAITALGSFGISIGTYNAFNQKP